MILALYLQILISKILKIERKKKRIKSLNKWFKANRPSLNFDKTNFMQFTTKKVLKLI